MERLQTLNLDTHKIFVFVRQDLPIEQQMVQAIHATFHASAGFGIDVEAEDDTFTGIPFVVLIGVPDSKALARVTTKLTANALLFDEFLDTDIDSKPSAIATYPLPPEQAALLASYRLWRYTPAPVSAGAFNGEAGANAPIAQIPCS